MAPWVMFNVTLKEDGYGLYETYSRKDIEAKNRVWTKCMLHFEKGLEPWNNLRCCYSIYWWDKTESISYNIPFIHLNEEKLVKQIKETNIDFVDNLNKCMEKESTEKKEEKIVENPPKPSLVRRALRKAKRIAKRLLRK